MHLIFRAVGSSLLNWAEITDFPHTPCLPPTDKFSRYRYPVSRCCICYNWRTYIDTHHYRPKSTLTLGFIPGVWANVWTTCIHNCGITQDIFTADKSSVLCLFTPLFPLMPDEHQSLLSPQLCLFQNAMWLESCSIQPFQIGSFHWVMCF